MTVLVCSEGQCFAAVLVCLASRRSTALRLSGPLRRVGKKGENFRLKSLVCSPTARSLKLGRRAVCGYVAAITRTSCTCFQRWARSMP